MRTSFVSAALFGVVLLGIAEISHPAPVSPVEVASIQVVPETPSVGQYPAISARVKRTKAKAPQEPLAATVIAVMTLPNNVVKSWTWKNVPLARGASKEFSVPKEYDIRLAGTYKVEFNVYSANMRRRFAASSKTFTVTDRLRPVEREAPPAVKPAPPRAPERNTVGLGIYGNALNPAGGATLMLWPFRNVGLQGTYTDGTFTSSEARLLVKLGRVSGLNPYIGAGYLSVSTEKDIFGVTTEFKDSGVSGVFGVEIPLGRRIQGHVEVSGAAIDLEKTVTIGAQTVKATVEYAPVTIGTGIVFYLF
jgi:hypothetical protein